MKSPPPDPALQPLLEAVYAAPDDDAPRVALAAWLTERGDPRGEFITRQLARTDGTNPLAEMKLLYKHRSAWLGALKPVTRYIQWSELGPDQGSWGMHVHARWHRGFLAGANVNISTARLKKMASLPVWATLEHVIHLTADGTKYVFRGPRRDRRGRRAVRAHDPHPGQSGATPRGRPGGG